MNASGQEKKLEKQTKKRTSFQYLLSKLKNK